MASIDDELNEIRNEIARLRSYITVRERRRLSGLLKLAAKEANTTPGEVNATINRARVMLDRIKYRASTGRVSSSGSATGARRGVPPRSFAIVRVPPKVQPEASAAGGGEPPRRPTQQEGDAGGGDNRRRNIIFLLIILGILIFVFSGNILLGVNPIYLVIGGVLLALIVWIISRAVGGIREAQQPGQAPQQAGRNYFQRIRNQPNLGGILIAVVVILAAILFLLINPFGFLNVSFLGGTYWWLIILIIILLTIVIFASRGNLNLGARRFFSRVWNFITNLFSRHWKLLLIILALILAFIYVISSFLTAGAGVIPGAFAVTWFRWIIAGIFGLLGIYLIFKTKDGKYPYRTLGIILVILAVLFGWLYPFLYSIISVSFADLFGLRWILTLAFIILGFYFMVKTNDQGKHVNFGLGLFLVILGIAFWVVVPFFSSALFEKYGLKGEIAAEEAGIAARLQRFWFYVKYPEKYFAEFGRFDNPQAQEKRAKVGLEIKKFEPIVGLFRSDQKIRLTAEIMHHALPKFDIIDEEEQEVNTVSIKFGCEADVDNKKINGTISIVREGLSLGNKEVVQDLLEGVQKNQNRSYFVFCDYEKGIIKNPQGKNESTIRVKLKSSYANFVTESILKNYVIGEKKYRDLVYENNNIKQNYELELLNVLRSAASYPGLVNNERKTISEYSSGPIKLSLTILNPQPLVTNQDVYTLILRSEPNSIDWEGKIEPKNIFLEAPNWFKIDDKDKCAFEKDSSRAGSSKLERYKLTENSARIIERCKGNVEQSGRSGCSFFCDFRIESNNEITNIEEYNIRGVQITDYEIEKSTTFDFLDLGFKEKEIEKNESVDEKTKEAECGNNVKEEGEECDDGNLVNDDGCSVECKINKQCNDNSDNDEDRLIDLDDPDCENSDDNSERDETPIA